ncbi:MAG TPA: hypothetical protein VLT88_00755 [Desulfosarcina sp.]|nr:hypothetical protein [Desulfosarcina sp.]
MRRPDRRGILILAAAVMALGIGLHGLAHARATFQIVFADGMAEGFNDPGAPDPASTAGGNAGSTLGDQRRIAFSRATQIWADQLDSKVPIVVAVEFDPTLTCNAGTANLGSAGTNSVHANFMGAPVSDTWYPAALANALAGTDLAPGTGDIDASFNSALDGGVCAFPLVWYYGLDGIPPPGTLDFISIALHELAHGLGFQTFMDPATGAKFGGLDDAFLLWLEDHTTGELLSDMASDAERAAASINTGNLHWIGPDVVAAAGGLTSGRHPSGHVEMHAPDPLAPGSSVSHFSTSLSPSELMEPSFTGANQDVGLTRQLFQDIGWPTAAPIVAPPAPAGGGGGGGGGGCFLDALGG